MQVTADELLRFIGMSRTTLEIPFSQSADVVEDTVILELAFVGSADG